MKKRFLPVLCMLLCCSFVFAEQDNNNPGADSIPDPAKALVGEWQGFVMNRDEPTAISSDRYCFLESGSWEIRRGGDKPDILPQGWYKVSDDKLYLQPHDAAEKKEEAAIPAVLRDRDRFVIQDMFDAEQALLFVRTDALAPPKPDAFVGEWTITQKDPESGETHVAPYRLLLKKDGTYRAEQPGEELPKEWAEGTYTISGRTVKLKNEFKGTGLWKDSEFFLFEGKLRYNNRNYCVWCEKKTEEKMERPNAEDAKTKGEEKPAVAEN